MALASPPSKESWRAQFRAARASFSPQQYAARSALIGQRALATRAVTTAAVVHVYWPLLNQREPDTRALISALRALGKEVVLPVVDAFPPAAPALSHRLYTGPQTLVSNKWGIAEPAGTPEVAPDALDVVLVPALGADSRGQRLGQGAGYYDTFLQDLSCPRLALVYANCVVPRLPRDPHDVPATALVTAQTVLPL